MILVNHNGKTISGSINQDVFNCTFTVEKYNALEVLVARSEATDIVAEYNEIVEEFKVLIAETLSGVIGTDNKYIYVDVATGNFYLKYNDVVSSVAMPKELVDRIKESVDKKIDYLPLVKSWVRWLRNPKLRKLDVQSQAAFSQRFFNFINIKFTNYELVDKLMSEKGYSKEIAIDNSTGYSMKISNEGLLVGFKVSKEITTRYRLNDKGEKESYNVYDQGKKSIDPISGLITTEPINLNNEDRVFEPAVQGKGGDEFYCGATKGHIIRVGQTHKLENWNQVNCNDNQSCVAGLHIGGLDYIRNYQNEGTSTHNIAVDPSHIGAIPDDSTGAIRCIQYFVMDEFSGLNNSIYHSSKYAKQTDDEFATARKEAIEAFGKLAKTMQDSVDKESKELEAL